MGCQNSSVVECLPKDKEVCGSSLWHGILLWRWATDARNAQQKKTNDIIKQSRWRNGLARLQQWLCYLQEPGFEPHLWPMEFFICNQVSPLTNQCPNKQTHVLPGYRSKLSERHVKTPNKKDSGMYAFKYLLAASSLAYDGSSCILYHVEHVLYAVDATLICTQVFYTSQDDFSLLDVIWL